MHFFYDYDVRAFRIYRVVYYSLQASRDFEILISRTRNMKFKWQTTVLCIFKLISWPRKWLEPCISPQNVEKLDACVYEGAVDSIYEITFLKRMSGKFHLKSDLITFFIDNQTL